VFLGRYILIRYLIVLCIFFICFLLFLFFASFEVRKQDGCEQRKKNVVTEGEHDNEKDCIVMELGSVS